MNFAGKITAFLAARRGHAICAAVLACAAAALVSLRAKFSENIYHLLPLSDPVVADHVWAGRVFNKSNALFFAVANKDEKSVEIADAFARALRGVDGVGRVVCGLDAFAPLAEGGAALAPIMFDSAAQSRLEKVAAPAALAARLSSLKKGVLQNDYRAKFALKTDPLGISGAVGAGAARSLAPAGAKAGENHILSPDGKYIFIAAYGTFDCANSAASAALVSKINSIVSEFKSRAPSFEVAFAGGYRVSAENAAAAARDSKRALLATLLIMLFICAFAFGNRKLALFALVPSLLGSVCAFAFAAAFFKTISAVSVAFAAIAIGVSIDYAIHILSFADKKTGRFSAADAVEAAQKYARPVAVVAGTTAMAFAIMAVFGGGGFVQLGVFGCVGICASALASVFLLPALLVGVRLKSSAPRTIPQACGGLLARAGLKPRAAAAFACAACVAAAFGLPKVRFSGDMSAFNALSPEARADFDFMQKTFGAAVSSKSVLLRGADLGEVLAANEKLRAFFAGRSDAQMFGAASLLVSPKTAAENLERWRGFWSAERLEAAELAARGEGFKSGFAAASVAALTRRAEAFSPQDLLKPPFADLFAQSLYAGEDCAAVSVSFAALKGFCAETFAQDLARAVPEARLIDPQYMGARIAGVSARWLVKFALASFAAVSVYLYFGLGAGLSGVAAVLAPLCAGLLWCFGLAGFLSLPINIVNAVFVVFAVCLAQDYAVFVFAELRGGGDCAAVYPPIAISAATTVAAFAVLAAAKHPVISGLGGISALSIISIFAATALLAPAASGLALGKNAKR